MKVELDEKYWAKRIAIFIGQSSRPLEYGSLMFFMIVDMIFVRWKTIASPHRFSIVPNFLTQSLRTIVYTFHLCHTNKKGTLRPFRWKTMNIFFHYFRSIWCVPWSGSFLNGLQILGFNSINMRWEGRPLYFSPIPI